VTVAFVAGATGYTGREVVRVLAGRGVETHAHVRPDSPAIDRWRERFREAGARVDETPWDAQAMDRALARIGPTHVFALLGTTRARARRATGSAIAETYEAVDLGLTLVLVGASLAAGSSPRFVYLSSMGTRPGAGAYLEARWKAEAGIRASGLAFTIVRAPIISGPDRDESRTGERIASVVSSAALSALGALGARRLRARYAPMTGAELAAGIVRAALEGLDGVVMPEALRAY
jgi:uncharacterized protein YbjT (DUF2867 family)